MSLLLMFVAAAVAVAALLVGAGVMARRLPWILVVTLLAGDIFGGIAMRALREFGKLPHHTGPPPRPAAVMLAAPVARWSATGTMAAIWIDDFFAEQAALCETLAACSAIRGGNQ